MPAAAPTHQVPVIHAYLNPLVKWVWLGGLVVVFGTILALVPSRQPVLALSRATEAIPLGPTQSPAHLPIERRESHD